MTSTIIGPDRWYRRATRAHVNCIENLPVFTAIVLVAAVVGVKTTALDVLGGCSKRSLGVIEVEG